VNRGPKRTVARGELAGIARSLNELLRRRLGDEAPPIGRRAKTAAGPEGNAVTRRNRRAAATLESRAETTAVMEESTLESLQERVASCRRCALHKTRTNVVFGSGSGSTRILFVGEAPGRDEDLQGLPFVGRAGQLLTKIIEAIEFRREDVYIANVLKCRPPNNRNPAPEEVARCRPFLMKQIELLKPKVICTLGVFATQMLLDTKSPLTVLRGQVHRVNGLAVMPTYHPAACLRYPKFKAAVWEDVQLLRKEYLS
jgi:DNA polymerase